MLRTLGSGCQPKPTHQDNQNLFKTDVKAVFLAESSAEKELSQQEIQQCAELMEKMISSHSELQSKASQLLEQVVQRNYGKGLGYYNCKNLLLLEYLIQLQYYQLFKVNGQSFTEGQGLELYKRLAYLKILLTKLTPVQKKLEYQKNKLLKYSQVVKVQPEIQKKQLIAQEQSEDDFQHDYNEGQQNQQQQNQEQREESGEEDALNYQPRPDALMVVKQKKQKAQLNEGKYVAPKISAVLSKEDKRVRKLQIQDQRKKAFLIRKFRGDLEDDDEAREVGVGSDIAEKIKQKFSEKIAVEEDNFMRMPESKQEKYWRKSLVRDKQRSNPLQQQFKDIQAIKQIFTQKKRQETVTNLLKRPKASSKVNSGKKKIKRDQ